MKKRIVSTLMALCMVLTLLPVQVLAAGGAAPQHQLDSTTIGQYTTLGNGVYTLTEDVSIISTLKITGEATLDLNGYMLRMTGSASVLTVESGGHLTIADSRPDAEERRFAPDGDGLWVLDATGEKSVTGGIITGGTGTLGQWYFYGGGVYVNSGGHLTMEGGSIVGCSAYGANGIYGDGGGVFLKSNYGESIDRTTFTMNGGQHHRLHRWQPGRRCGCRAEHIYHEQGQHPQLHRQGVRRRRCGCPEWRQLYHEGRRNQ